MNNRIRELKIGSAKIDKVVQDFDCLNKMLKKTKKNALVAPPAVSLFKAVNLQKIKYIKAKLEIDLKKEVTRTEVINIININFYNVNKFIQEKSHYRNNYIYYLVTTDMGREFIMTDLNIVNKAMDVNIRAKVTYLINSCVVLEGQVV